MPRNGLFIIKCVGVCELRRSSSLGTASSIASSLGPRLWVHVNIKPKKTEFSFKDTIYVQERDRRKQSKSISTPPI